MLFGGTVASSRALPRDYLLKYLLITTPPALLVLSGVGIVAGLFRMRQAAAHSFLFLLVVRASLLLQISGTPFFQVRNIDGEVYHLWAAWSPMMAERLSLADRRRVAAVFAAGGLVIILPLVAWNTGRGGGVMLTSGDAGLNFYNGNNERASGLPAKPIGLRDVPQYEEGDARWLAERTVGHRLSPAEVSRYWTDQALTWIARHPGDWLVVMGKKLLTLWNAFEVPDNYHYAFHACALSAAAVAAGDVRAGGPLALVGLAMPFWRRTDLPALYIACGIYLSTVVLFYVRADSGCPPCRSSWCSPRWRWTACSARFPPTVGP